ncbi:MAG TPA: aminotransferase class I/II-fold pyridoxal phosphate-dependent enzyme, partial [Gammaproteobacteria bacterium]|nr:aminotransferase class I/II-fold pyridoxal phosphate-dependent enzyme [Gammaproteobacteria bacterium]
AQILEANKTEFRQRRDYLFDAIQSLGFQVQSKPQGAFYLYANSSSLAADSYQLAEDLLEKAGVAITPGKDFGQAGASQHVRFAYTTSLPQLERGIECLGKYLRAGK